jgi:SAM-dependent methyltransferase
LKKLHRLIDRAFGPRLAYAAVSLIDAVASQGWRKPLITAQGNYHLTRAYPQLAAPASALRSALSPSPLCLAMAHHGSDKGLRRHNYTALYHAMFSSVRSKMTRLFELGIGTTDVTLKSHMGKTGRPGASLRAWRDYFPNACIFAADIDRNVLFTEERIRCFYCDQTDSASMGALWADPALALPFDIIIDDGLHTFDANRCFFEHSFDKLAAGGVFLIEDVLVSALPAWESFLERFASARRELSWAIVELHHPFNSLDNNLVLVRNVST